MRVRALSSDALLRWRARLAPLRDRSGAIIILTAIAMPLLVMVIGFAADFAYATYINQRLARAADAAVISATSQSAATAVGGYPNTAGLRTYGMNIFRENIKGLPVSSPNFKLTVIRDSSSGLVTATGSYATSTPALFGQILGITSIPIKDSVQSTARPAVYINYYILVDTSQSMGVASTQSDMNTLYSRVAQFGQGSDGESGCVYGCHVKVPNQAYTNEQLAHDFSPKVTLRIDSAVQAVQSIISTAASLASSTDNIQFGLYMIQADPVANTKITTVSAPSSNYANLYNLAGTIDLGNNVGSVGYGDSDFSDELTTFNTMLPANGSGVSAASPQNYVFIVTDGVTDTYSGSCFDTHCTSAIDSSLCTQLKAKATVGVIYTTFLPIYNYDKPGQLDPVYTSLVLPIADQIAPALQDCATSSDYYFEATYGTDIINAMHTLFVKTLPSSTRLIQ